MVRFYPSAPVTVLTKEFFDRCRHVRRQVFRGQTYLRKVCRRKIAGTGMEVGPERPCLERSQSLGEECPYHP